MPEILSSRLARLIVALFASAPVFAAEVSIETWAIPPSHKYPTDVMIHSDGTVWFAARLSNTIGRFDPLTEAWSQFVVDVRPSGPYGLAEDSRGNVWFTAIDADPTYVARLDPENGTITEFPVEIHQGSTNVPLPSDAYHISVDDDDNVWFTMSVPDMIGRLNPSNGEITLARSPVRQVLPSSIVLDSEGNPWVSMSGSSLLARMSPSNLGLELHNAPSPATRLIRIAVDDNDVVWYTDPDHGSIGRFDPRTDRWDDWQTPGGMWSRPYGIVSRGDAIWYNESWAVPSRLVRFDPRSEEFESWAIGDCFDGTYSLVTDAVDDIWFVCHDTNLLGRVRVRED